MENKEKETVKIPKNWWPFSVETVRGLVRPYISFVFASVTGYLAITGAIDAKDMLSITGIIVAFHFGEKSALKKP